MSEIDFAIVGRGPGKARALIWNSPNWNISLAFIGIEHLYNF
jgi:hypothetical protein